MEEYGNQIMVESSGCQAAPVVTSKRHWCQLAGSVVVCYRAQYCQHFHSYLRKRDGMKFNSIQLTFTEWQLHAAYYMLGAEGRKQNQKAPSIQCSIWEGRRNLKLEDVDNSLSFAVHRLCDFRQVNSYFCGSVVPIFKIGNRDNYLKELLGGSYEVL